MTVFALLFTLAAIGISETEYLWRKRRHAQEPACPIGGGCSVVLESEFNRTFFLSNDLLGLLGYSAIAIVASFNVLEIRPEAFWQNALSLLVGIASLLSVYFTFLQWRVIRAWCFWCLLSAITIWFMGLIIIAQRLNG